MAWQPSGGLCDIKFALQGPLTMTCTSTILAFGIGRRPTLSRSVPCAS